MKRLLKWWTSQRRTQKETSCPEELRPRLLLASELLHDLKGLVSVVYSSSILVREESKCEIAQSYVDQIIRSSERLNRMLEDIISLNQSELGGLPIRLGDFSPTDELVSIVQGYKPRAESKGLRLTLRFAGSLPSKARTDSLRLGQIVSNLISNAVKFTESGGVEVVCGHDGEMLHITVSDTGVGIPPHDRERIFETYFGRQHRTGKEPGHGLGLALSRRIARLLGGDLVIVFSEQGHGSTFRATLKAPPVERSSVVPLTEVPDAGPD